MSDLAVWVIVGGVVGARVFYVLQYWDRQFADHPIDAIKIWEGGLVFYGGFLGGTVAGFWFVGRRNLSPWEIGDIVAPSVMLAYALGRIGCLLNGCCWGGLSGDSTWGLAFPGHYADGHWTPLFDWQLQRGAVTPLDPACQPVYPVQALSALAGFLLFFVLDWRKARRYQDRLTGY